MPRDNSMDTREYATSHPWITYRFDASNMHPWFWEQLGEARSKCRHLALSPLQPSVADHMHALFLAKGAHATTAIEGNTLTEDQVLEAVQGTLALPPSQEYLGHEIQNILTACTGLEDTIMREGKFELSVALLGSMNARVLSDLVVPDHVVPGEFRDHQVGVGTYKGAPASDVEYLTEQMCTWLNSADFTGGEDKREAFLRTILRAVLAHIYIAWIHPFGDGNGRTARLVEFGILTAAGVPSVAAHLLSNHYNQTRSAYYRHLQESSRSGGDVRGFLRYAVEGFVDQLQAQLTSVHDQNWRSTWQNYVHEQFRDRDGGTSKRQRELCLALGEIERIVPRRDIRLLTPELAEAYAGKGAKTISRDLNKLEDMGLIARSPEGIRARLEIIFRLAPRVAGGLVVD